MLKKTPLKTRYSALRRTPLRRKGKSPTAELKDAIQAELRRIVIKRDKGCFLRHYSEAGACGGYRKDGQLILQAEHLHSRSHAVSFSDPRLVVCICKRHHIYWKPQYSARYNELAEEFIGPERAKLWSRVREDYRPHKVDLALELVALKNQ